MELRRCLSLWSDAVIDHCTCSSSSDDDDDDELEDWEIGLIAAGVALFLLLLIGLIIFLVMKRGGTLFVRSVLYFGYVG